MRCLDLFFTNIWLMVFFLQLLLFLFFFGFFLLHLFILFHFSFFHFFLSTFFNKFVIIFIIIDVWLGVYLIYVILLSFNTLLIRSTSLLLTVLAWFLWLLNSFGIMADVVNCTWRAQFLRSGVYWLNSYFFTMSWAWLNFILFSFHVLLVMLGIDLMLKVK